MNPATCTATYRPRSGDNGEAVPCFRTDTAHLEREVGEHQGWEDMAPSRVELPGHDPVEHPAWRRLWTWDESGAHGTARTRRCYSCHESPSASRVAKTHSETDHHDVVCTECGTLYDTAQTEPGLCSSCEFWNQRAALYAANQPGPHGGVLVRTADSDSLYCWSPKSAGGFGGRTYLVTVRRGEEEVTYGPGDNLWHNGRIPPWRSHQFEPNGTIEHVSQVKLAGHLDAWGQPLAYTGGPDPAT